MPRPNKPWFWEARGEWCVKINGVRHRLGPDKEIAYQKFHELAAKPKDRPLQKDAVLAILDAFLEFSQVHNAPKTYRGYKDFLQSFIGTIPKTLTIGQLRPYHIQTWVDSHRNWSQSTKRGGIVAVKRALRWACKQGYIDSSPIAYLEAPEGGKREKMVSPEEFEAIIGQVKDHEFSDLLVAAYETGARPQEVCRVEARHVDLENARWVFPTSEAKGKKKARVVYLSDRVLEITKRLMLKHPDGPIFRNIRGNPWTADATNCRFRQLKKKLGFKYCMYQFRHTRTTKALEAGLATEVVRELMGHQDGRMIAKHYGHLAQNPKHLREQAKKAVS